MASLLLIVLAINVVTYLINTIGATTIDSLLWLLYTKLPTQTSRTSSEYKDKKREVVQLKRDMNATSSQDEFAKWAKLRRRHDKAMEECEAKGKKLSEHKSSFDMAVKSVRWVSTTGLKLFLQMWYSKSPIFDLPNDWFPWQMEWILSFPRAPRGTVSIQIWGGACGAVVSLVGDAVGALIVYLMSRQSADTAKAGNTAGNQEKEKPIKAQ